MINKPKTYGFGIDCNVFHSRQYRWEESTHAIPLFFQHKEMQHIIFYAHVHACSPSYTDEKWKTLQSISKQCVFGLLIIVMVMTVL